MWGDIGIIDDGSSETGSSPAEGTVFPDSKVKSGGEGGDTPLSETKTLIFPDTQTDASVFYDFIINDLAKNNVIIDNATKEWIRKVLLGTAAPVGFSGNWLYWKWSWDFIFENLPTYVPYEVKAFLAICFISGNGVTNGILTTKPLMELLHDLLRPYSEEERAIYHSEIPNAIRGFYNATAFVLSVGGQISPAYLVYYQMNILALAVLLIASNMGFTWQSFYQLFCDVHMTRLLTADEKKIQAAKGHFQGYIRNIQNELVRCVKNKTGRLSYTTDSDILTLIEALGSRKDDHPIQDINQVSKALYHFHSSFPEDKEKIPNPLNQFEEILIHMISLVLLGTFLMFYWYGGGAAGRTIFNSDAGFYALAIFSIFCVFYLSGIYMHGSVRGVYTSVKNFIQDKEVPDLAHELFPKATLAWDIFAIVSTLFSWAFAARHVQVAFAKWLHPWCLSVGVFAVVLLLGYSMIAIRKPAVFWLMKKLGQATSEELKYIILDEKLEHLIKMTGIANHHVFAEFIRKINLLIPLEPQSDNLHDDRFGISRTDIEKYFQEYDRNTDVEQGKSSSGSTLFFDWTKRIRTPSQSLSRGSLDPLLMKDGATPKHNKRAGKNNSSSYRCVIL